MLTKKVSDFIKKSFKKGNVVSLTGAGISFESGIPTFRGKGGLWESYDPQVYATMEGLVSVFRDSPGKFIDFISDFYNMLLKVRPNLAHISLCALEKAGILKSVITQNIDNLHSRAGMHSVVELHGNAFRIRCQGCQGKITLEKDRVAEMVKLLEKNRDSRIKLLRVFSRYCPRCKICGSRFRIDIVFFGEMLPQDELTRAYKLLDNCKVLLVVGSSLIVYPAAALPLYAKERGAKLLEVNSEPSALSDLCDYKIIGKAGEILPQIVGLLDLQN
jgi:NAD-dependent deacetylase